MKKILSILFPIKTVYAHCDIPCGIYDPHAAQVAAHTVIRMTKMLMDLDESDDKKSDHQIVRLTKVKEEHAEIVKHEVTVLWGDYFKDEHLKKYPQLTEAVFHTLKLASKTKHEINLEAAEDLLSHVQEIAETFFNSKDIKSKKIKAYFPTEGDIVVPE